MLNIIDNNCSSKLIPKYDGDIEADIAKIKTVKQAKAIVGGLSNPSKMPGFAYNLPASECKKGAKLVLVPGSVCHGCYCADTIEWTKRKNAAAGGKWRLTRYTINTVKKALARRHESLSDPLWVPAMAFLIKWYAKKGNLYFRWHDSGDIQDRNHFDNIVAVARYTGEVKQWLPTREYSFIHTDVPDNLILRLSAHMVNQKPIKTDLPTSTVSTTALPILDQRCPATEDGSDGKCGDCRNCWDSTIKNIDYRKH